MGEQVQGGPVDEGDTHSLPFSAILETLVPVGRDDIPVVPPSASLGAEDFSHGVQKPRQVSFQIAVVVAFEETHVFLLQDEVSDGHEQVTEVVFSHTSVDAPVGVTRVTSHPRPPSPRAARRYS